MTDVVLAVTDGCGNVVHFDPDEALVIEPYDDAVAWVSVYGIPADSTPEEPWESDRDEPGTHGWYGHVETVVVGDV